jgi:hypothetical protein
MSTEPAWHPPGIDREGPPDDPPASWPSGACIALVRECAGLGCERCRRALGDWMADSDRLAAWHAPDGQATLGGVAD